MNERVGNTKGARAARAKELGGRGVLIRWVARAAICCAAFAAGTAARADQTAPAARMHVVQRGETVSLIAARYGVAPEALALANGLAGPATLREGRMLTIPVVVADGILPEMEREAARSSRNRATRQSSSRARTPKGTGAKAANSPATPGTAPTAGAPGTRQTMPAQRPIVTPPGREPQPVQQPPPGSTPPTASALRRTPETTARISVNFANVSARDALAAVAEHTGVDILITPGTTGNVSINLRERTADEAIRQIAAVGGLSVGVIGATYVVGPPPEVQKAIAELGKTEVVTLRYAKPEAAREVLSRAVPRVSVDVAGNTVVLSGLPEDLKVARAALDVLDVAPPEVAAKPRTEFVILRNGDPAQAERMICDAFPELKVARQDRLFTLTGTPADLESASKALKMLDVQPVAAQTTPPPAPTAETAVVQLRYVNARTAEETLKKLLPNLVVAAAPEPTAPPPANFQPLSLGMMGSTSTSGSSSGGFNFSSQSVTTATNNAFAPAQTLNRATRVVLMGSAADIAAARRILEETDVAPPLVRIEAAVLEVNKNTLRELGISWDFTNAGITFILPGNERSLSFPNLTFAGVDPSSTRPELANTSFRANLQALITQSRARLIANPNITVADNEDASIFIGDLRRFRGISVVTPDVGTVQGTETIPVGIALLVRPRIHPDDSVTLKVHPVVSSVSDIVDGLPQTASREADTTVRLNRGEQLAIGGLDREETVRQTRRVPILGDIPLIGELFTSRSTVTQTTEIIVLIAAYAVQPEAAPPVAEFPRPIGDLP